MYGFSFSTEFWFSACITKLLIQPFSLLTRTYKILETSNLIIIILVERRVQDVFQKKY